VDLRWSIVSHALEIQKFGDIFYDYKGLFAPSTFTITGLLWRSLFTFSAIVKADTISPREAAFCDTFLDGQMRKQYMARVSVPGTILILTSVAGHSLY
jgi:hypothetical protein